MQEAIEQAFETQLEWCSRLGSLMSSDLLRVARDDLVRGGPTLSVVDGFEGDPIRAALALRFLGGVHRLVLSGGAPDLAPFYPTVGGVVSDDIAAPFLAAISDNTEYLVESIKSAPQTNEVGRSALLMPGISAALGERRLAVRLFEIGSAGGLNLLLDRFRYELGDTEWGPPESPVLIRSDWKGPSPELVALLDIVERRGCDVAPIDITSDEERLGLLSFVWADQVERFNRTQAAIDLGSSSPPPVDRADAGEWVEKQLSRLPDGAITVIQHSIMWQYLPSETQEVINASIAEAGARATASGPLAHVRFEPALGRSVPQGMLLTVTIWPGGVERILARGHAHGAWVEWFEQPLTRA